MGRTLFFHLIKDNSSEILSRVLSEIGDRECIGPVSMRQQFEVPKAIGRSWRMFCSIARLCSPDRIAESDLASRMRAVRSRLEAA
jgi:hypothetical protein